MTRQFKIAIYTGVFPNPSFIEHLISGIALYHQVIVFGTKKGKVNYGHANVKVVETPTSSWYNVALTLVRSVRLLFKSPKLLGIAYREAKRYPSSYEQWMRFSRFVPVLLYQPDIFHLQWPVRLYRWEFLKRAYGCKIVVSALGSQVNIRPYIFPELAREYRHFFSNVDCFHTVSNSLKNDLIMLGVQPKIIQCIHSIINPRLLNAFKGITSDRDRAEFNFVSVGRCHWVKGYSYALDAIKYVIEVGMNVSYTIIGEDKVPEELLFQVHHLGLQEVVRFEGAMPQELLFETMQKYHGMLVPSVSEGIANVAIEGMALGVPVIAANCGGMGELITDGISGWLVPIRDVKALADAIIAVCQCPIERLNEVAEEAYNKIVSDFHPDLNRKRMLQMYEVLYK